MASDSAEAADIARADRGADAIIEMGDLELLVIILFNPLLKAKPLAGALGFPMESAWGAAAAEVG